MSSLLTDEQPLPIQLDGETQLWLWQQVLPCDQAQQLLQHLRDSLPWEQPQLHLFGKHHPIPRLASWHGDASYRYSGKLFAPHPWTPELRQACHLAETLTGKRFNSVLCNLYRNGDDRMGWHADDEPELGASPWIASLSLGAKRDFCLKRKGEHQTFLRLALPHNSLLLMAPAVQQHWQHALPSRKREREARLNLTFRHLLTG